MPNPYSQAPLPEPIPLDATIIARHVRPLFDTDNPLLQGVQAQDLDKLVETVRYRMRYDPRFHRALLFPADYNSPAGHVVYFPRDRLSQDAIDAVRLQALEAALYELLTGKSVHDSTIAPYPRFEPGMPPTQFEERSVLPYLANFYYNKPWFIKQYYRYGIGKTAPFRFDEFGRPIKGPFTLHPHTEEFVPEREIFGP